MNKKVLTRLAGQGLSTRGIAEKTNNSQTNVRYWLKKHGLQTKHNEKNYRGIRAITKTCFLCEKSYIHDGKLHKGRICGSCRTKIRRYRTKAAGVKYLGGSCKKCGYKKSQHAMHFHHKDPSEKDFNIGAVAHKSWKFIKQELDKCELLCANCHIIEHTTRTDPRFLKEVNAYRGKTLDF